MSNNGMVEKHFVTFYSPGTFVAEETTRPIDSWDTGKAVEIADTITERYNATPYAFRFSTRSRGEDDLDSRVTGKSGLYYLGGRIDTLEEIKKRGDPQEHILVSNMESNDWSAVIVNENSWKVVRPLETDDTILDYTPPSKRPQEKFA